MMTPRNTRRVTGRRRWTLVAQVIGLAFVLGVGGCSSGSSGGKKKKNPPPPPPPPVQVDLDEADVFLELNATDEDLGIHFFVDGDGWESMRLFDPSGVEIYSVVNGGTLNLLGSTEFFTESAEPEFTVLDPAIFLGMFPQGIYRFSGISLQGEELIGDSDLEHQMPSMPDIVTTPDEDNVSAGGTLLVTWTLDPVLPGGGALVGGAPIEKFEVVVEQEDPNEILPELIFRADVPAGATQFTVPGEALVPGMEAKVEVLAYGENGNKTAGEVELGEILP